MARDRRNDDDDDFDDRPVKKKELSGLDGMFANTNMIILVIFGLCCNGCFFLPLILSTIEVFTGTDEKAQANAKVVMIISIIMVTIGVVGNIVRFMILGSQGFLPK